MARSFYVILSIFFLSFYYVSGALFGCLVPFTLFNKILVENPGVTRMISIPCFPPLTKPFAPPLFCNSLRHETCHCHHKDHRSRTLGAAAPDRRLLCNREHEPKRLHRIHMERRRVRVGGSRLPSQVELGSSEAHHPQQTSHRRGQGTLHWPASGSERASSTIRRGQYLPCISPSLRADDSSAPGEA